MIYFFVFLDTKFSVRLNHTSQSNINIKCVCHNKKISTLYATTIYINYLMQSWHKQSGNWLYYGNNDIEIAIRGILHPNKYIYNQNLSKWHKFIYCRLSLLQIPITTSKWRGIFAYNATKPLFGNTSINLMHKYVLVDFIISS